MNGASDYVFVETLIVNTYDIKKKKKILCRHGIRVGWVWVGVCFIPELSGALLYKDSTD